MRRKKQKLKKNFLKKAGLMLCASVFAFSHTSHATPVVASNYDDFRDKLLNIGDNGSISLNESFGLTDTLSVNSNFTLLGDNKALSGQNSHRLFDVASGKQFNLSNLTLENGLSSSGVGAGKGGAIYTDGSFSGDITNGMFNGNKVVLEDDNGYGGAIYVGGDFTGNLSGGIFSGNEVKTDGYGYGGAIYTGGNFTGNISNVDFIGNIANKSELINDDGDVDYAYKSGYGGAIYAEGAFAGNISGSNFTDNQAGTSGGAIYTGGNFTGAISGSTFSGNKANVLDPIYIDDEYYQPVSGEGSGGAIFVGGNFKNDITDSTFSGNMANGMNASGGAISIGRYGEGGEGSDDGESGDGSGGSGIFNNNFTGNIINSNFSGNKVTSFYDSSGGAIYVGGKFTGDIIGGKFSNNEVATIEDFASFVIGGGAIYTGGDFTGSIKGAEFTGNKVHSDGAKGGALLIMGDFKGDIVGSVFDNNQLMNKHYGNNRGGAMFVSGDFIGDIAGSTFSNNGGIDSYDGKPHVYGGALYIGLFEGGNFKGNIKGSNFINNNGSAIYISDTFTGNIEENSVFKGNFTNSEYDQGGAAIYIGNGFKGNILNSEFSDNSTLFSYGGAIRVGSDYDSEDGFGGIKDGEKGNITGSLFSGNKSGGIYKQEYLNTDDEYVVDYYPSAGRGGAIYSEGNFKSDITGSYFKENNVAGDFGGAIYTAGNFAGDIIKSDFEGNAIEVYEGAGKGGAIYAEGSFKGDITGSYFTNNKIAGSEAIHDLTGEEIQFYSQGGAIFAREEFTGNISDSHFTGNEAGADGSVEGYGGAIYTEGSFKGDITGSSFTNNKAVGYYDGYGGGFGGAISAEQFAGNIKGSSFAGNSVTSGYYGWGGAINAGEFFKGDIAGSYFTNNSLTSTYNGYGGAIYAGDEFTGDISESHFTGNNVKIVAGGEEDNLYVAGGAIFTYGILEGNINKSSFSNNSVTGGDRGHGGAIYAGEAFFGNISESGFIGNKVIANAGAGDVYNPAYAAGGAIYAGENFKGDIKGSSFRDNSISGGDNGYGGAIYAGEGSFVGNISESSFIGNKVSTAAGVGDVDNLRKVAGGAIFTHGLLEGDITSSSFADNSISGGDIGSGGAIYAGSDFTGNVTGVHFTNNSVTGGATGCGGAIYSGVEFTGNVTGSYFINNGVTDNTGYGGAIYAKDGFIGDIRESYFTGNMAGTAEGAGGAIFTEKITGDVEKSYFKDNQSAGDGGAIYAKDGFVGNIRESYFIDNKVIADEGAGGAIFTGAFTGDVEKGYFKGNRSASSGGAFYADSFKGSMNGTFFTGNNTGGSGGAIYAKTDFTASIDDVKFIGNKAGELGGAMYVGNNLALSVSAGKSAIFSGNRDGFGASGIYFAGGTDVTANFNVDGDLYFYDPLASSDAVKVEKNGKGTIHMFGRNALAEGSSFVVNEGTIRILPNAGNKNVETRSMLMRSAFVNDRFELIVDKFAIGNGAKLEIAPSNTHAYISADSGVSLNSDITIVNDYRYVPRLEVKEWTVVLELNRAYDGDAMNLPETAGIFHLGQYDYYYDGLRWGNDDKELGFGITKTVENPDMSGSYNADSYIRTYVFNETPNKIFDHMGNAFKQMKGDHEKKLQRNLWGSAFHSYTKNDPVDIYAGSTTKVPGFVLGKDFAVGNNSFVGVAASVAWPDYNQGSFKDSGLDTRLSIYGGHILGNDVEFGWLATYGFGHLKGNRKFMGESFYGKRDVKSYALGVSLSKDFKRNDSLSFRPFMSLEYLKPKVDGCRETGNEDYAIGISSLSSNIFRLKTGLHMTKAFSETESFRGSLYYQGLYGDIRPVGKSSMNAAPDDFAIMRGAGIDKHYLGLGIAFTKDFSKRTSFSFDYNALLGKKSNSNNFSLSFEVKF